MNQATNSGGIPFVRLAWFLFALFIVIVFAIPTVFAQEEAVVAALPQPDGSLLIVMNAAAVKQCEARGGCRIVTSDDIEAFAAHLKKSCGPQI